MRRAIYKTPYRNVVVPLHEPTTGISYSGGADSVILLYLLLLNGLVPDKIYTTYRTGFKNKSITDCLVWLENKFDVDLQSRLHEFQLVGNQLRRDIYETMSDEVDWLYTGVTQNPLLDNFNLPIQPRRPLTAMDNKYRGYVTPFCTFDKRATIFLYHYLGVPDLLELTRSCAKPETDGVCGKCFHCLEKEWAIKEVEKVLL